MTTLPSTIYIPAAPPSFSFPPTTTINTAVPRHEHDHNNDNDNNDLLLSPTTRHDLSTLLLRTGAVRSLKRTLDEACLVDESTADDNGEGEEGKVWRARIHNRALELLSQRDRDEEAEAEAEGDDAGDIDIEARIIREVIKDSSTASTTRPDLPSMRSKRKDSEAEMETRTDVAIPAHTVLAAQRLVRRALEEGGVQVREEVTDGWEG